MGVKRSRLGRGLDALLGSAMPAPGLTDGAQQGELRDLPLEKIRRSRYQPRTALRPEALQELADSIRVQGVVQPIVVRPAADDSYEIVAGERRWRAAQLAGLEQIPSLVRDLPDQAAMAIALIENIQRENLNPIEEALALSRLIKEFGMTHHQAAEAVGRSRAAVSNLLRLLELTVDVKAMLEQGSLEMGHARALLAVSGVQQSEAARQVVARRLSVRETERLVQRLQNKAAPRQSRISSLDPDIRRLQDDLAARLGTAVKIQLGPNGTGKGRLIIDYHSLDELDGILAHIK
jgi:ParB-like partition proteins